MADLIQTVAFKGLTKNKGIADFKSGDTVGVYVRVREGEKERVQLYKGVVLKIQGAGMGRSFTVRKMSSGVGVERTFPYASPVVDRVEVISRGKVRRSKLYFLRNLRGKAATIQSELVGESDHSSVSKEDAAAKKEAAAQKDAAPKA